MAANNTFYGSYTAPGILEKARELVNFPRRDYSTNFAFLIAGDDEDREEYTSGLVVLGYILASVLFIWWAVLAVLRCKGKSVGCASGRSFRGERIHSSRNNQSAASTDLEDEWLSGEEAGEGQDGEELLDDISFHSSIKSSEMEDDIRSSLASESEESDISEISLSRASPRERRTQIAFFLFGLFTLAMVPLVLTLAFSPFKRASDSTETYVEQSRSLLSQVENSLNTIDVTVRTASRVFSEMPETISNLCPARSFQEIKEEYGVELEFVSETLLEEYRQVYDSIERRLSDIISNTGDFNEALDTVEKAHKESEAYLWAVPGLMLALTSVTAALLFGVLLAWKRQSNRQAQQTLTRFVLPCLILLSLACWAIGIASAISVALMGDGCTGGVYGTPAGVVDSVLSLQGYDQNSTTFQVVHAFINGCPRDVNPTAFIESTEGDVNLLIHETWEYISRIEAVGQDVLMNACGSGALVDVVTDAQDIAGLLTSIRRALNAVASSIRCEEIYPIYVGSVENAVCTDLAISFSWSMYIFLLLGVSTMCMITLRASWRHKVGEDQIYNEDEVDENMFLDEHEEYLHYISKYKHEWEEYGGITSAAHMAARHHPPSIYQEPSHSEEGTGSRTNSQEAMSEMNKTEDDFHKGQLESLNDTPTHEDPLNQDRGDIPSAPSVDYSTDMSFPSLRLFRSNAPDAASRESVEVVKRSNSQTGDRGEISLSSSSSFGFTVFKNSFEGVKTSGSGNSGSTGRSRRSGKNLSHCVNDNQAVTRTDEVGRKEKLDKHSSLKPSQSEESRLQRKSWKNKTNVSHLSTDLQHIRDKVNNPLGLLERPTQSLTDLQQDSSGSFDSRRSLRDYRGRDLAEIIRDLEQKSNAQD